MSANPQNNRQVIKLIQGQAPWSSGHRSGLRSERSAVQISARAKTFICRKIICLLYSIFIPSVRREKARPHELTRRSGRAKDDAEEI